MPTQARILLPLLLALATPVGACAQRQAGATVPAGPAAADDLAALARHPKVAAALASLRATNAWTLDQQASICEIPAPPFKEAARAAEYRRRLEALGLVRPRVDSVGNVIAERPGSGGGPTVVVSGHLDTVFPEGTDVRVRREGTRLFGPGIGDDCRGLAVVLAVARAFDAAGVATHGDVIFVGTVGEEGAGDLRGVRHLLGRELRGRAAYFISVDGAGEGLTSRAVGSLRYRVRFLGPGGHSYSAFGLPNPVHAMGRAIARIGDLRPPASPRTTFNVGVVSGGTSVNAIPAEATMDVDLRSESAEALAAVDAQLRAAVDSALAEEQARWPASPARLRVVLDTIGVRPAGTQPDSARVVRVAREAARALGAAAPAPEASSTDANYPIGVGLPAITMDGGGAGGGSHSLGEWYDDAPNGYRGAQWVALVVAALAGVR